MVRTRMLFFVPFFIVKETNTCILGRMYFVERSIYFKSIHLTINFTGAQALGAIIDRLLRQCCFVWSKLQDHTNVYIYIYIDKKKPTNRFSPLFLWSVLSKRCLRVFSFFLTISNVLFMFYVYMGYPSVNEPQKNVYKSSQDIFFSHCSELLIALKKMLPISGQSGARWWEISSFSMPRV